MSSSKFAAVMVLLVAVGCSDGGDDDDDGAADGGTMCDLPLVYEKSPGPALEGSGWHRVYVQGNGATPMPDGRFGMSEQRNEIASGDHFLLSGGALVEFTYPIVDAITGHVFLHLARVDDPGVVARYDLWLVHAGEQIPIFSLDDPDSGDMGYVPFERCFFDGDAAIVPEPGDSLLMRVTNVSGGMLGVVIRSPDYFTWLDVEVQ